MNKLNGSKQGSAWAWALVLCTLLVVTSGCTSIRRLTGRETAPKAGLLAPRLIVPPPYTGPAPAEQATGAMLPPEPQFPPMPPPVTGAPQTMERGSVQLPPPVESELLTYTVEKGDSLWKIAELYGVSMQELAAVNDMKLTDVLKPGKVLQIPPGGRLVPPSEKRKTSAPSATTSSSRTSSAAKQPIPAGGLYKVKPGDSLWTIAHRYGVKMDDIRALNALKTDVLQVGQELKLPAGAAGTTAPATRTAPPKTTTAAPAPAAPPAAAPAAEAGDANAAAPEAAEAPAAPAPATVPELALPKTLEHQVSPGETLESIASMYEIKVEDIKKANPQVKADADLQPNMTLTIPYR